MTNQAPVIIERQSSGGGMGLGVMLGVILMIVLAIGIAVFAGGRMLGSNTNAPNANTPTINAPNIDIQTPGITVPDHITVTTPNQQPAPQPGN